MILGFFWEIFLGDVLERLNGDPKIAWENLILTPFTDSANLFFEY